MSLGADTLGALTLAIVLVGSPLSARASTPADTAQPATTPEAHKRHYGAFGVFGSSWLSPYNKEDPETMVSSTGVKMLYGGGAFVKIYLDEKGYWALESAVRVMGNSKDGTVYVPIDLVVQRIFKVKPWLKPFIGLGATTVPIVYPGDTPHGTGLEMGGTLDLGAYWPIGKSPVSVLTALNYNLVYDVTNLKNEAHRLHHEAGLTAGVSYTF